MTYTTRGSVRGTCGHAHRTLSAAYACFRKDMRACKLSCGPAGYSDRRAERTDGKPLSEAELDAWYDAALEADR